MSSNSAYVFDLGGVVCRFEPERRLAALARVTGRSPAAVDDAIWKSDVSRRCDLGDLDVDDIVALVREEIGFAGTYEELAHLWSLAFVPDDAVLGVVDRVRQNAPTALLTNNPPMVHDALPVALPAVARAFDRLFFSYALGACKPDAQVFARVTDALGCDAGAITFVDDSAPNVAAAAAAGWHALLFDQRTDLDDL